ncbi:hypothetical protein HD806DRAFT_486137 [Xylariaceae sp. AK1471]|nr:hypothetical protein HD806DRAFT_486137 [Xylariaceae sp. AK1471]
MMKSLKMSKVFSSIKRKNTSGPDVSVNSDADSPEAIAVHSVKAFCESGGPNNAEAEVIHLPPIVDAAESSPAAAQKCAELLREYLKKDYWTRPDYQYNALMLVRILADNPGPTFTRNLGKDFKETAKDLLRNGRNPSVVQMLMETLESFENTKSYDEGLTHLIEMWKKEKGEASEKAKKKAHKSTSGRAPIQAYLQGPPQQPPSQPLPMMTAPPVDPHSQNYFARNHHTRRLPDPVELTGRLEEARTSAKLLQQVVANTPPGEFLDNDLIKEFAERCQSATRSIQGYMASENPVPDNETMESLIDTNEQLQTALNLHRRAMLNARKHVASLATDGNDLVDLDETPTIGNGLGHSRPPSPPGAGLGINIASGSGSKQPAAPPQKANGKGKEREYEPLAYAGSSGNPSRSHTPHTEEDPFRDPDESTGSHTAGGSSNRYFDQEPRLAFEPFHPGFDTTPSYAGRQDSAIGKEAMHGAVGNTASGKSTDIRPQQHANVSDDNSELYDAPPPKQNEPIYRY